MTSQPNIVNQLINPLYVQSYQRYLPTAFDEGMTLLEKMNKVIVSLNQIGMLSNNVLDQWNQVMDWIMSDGLDSAMDAKINAMLADGSLATVIGNAITNLGNEIGDITTLTTTNKTSIVAALNGLESEIGTTKAAIETDLTNGLATKAYKYYGTPEEYGAKGDGVTDDSTALQNCLTNSQISILSGTYLVSKTITLPKNHSIDGNHAKILVGNSFSQTVVGSNVPANTILYIEPRQPIYQSELNSGGAFVKDLRIVGNSTLTLTGIFLGVTDKTLVTQGSSVNFSVFGVDFENIDLAILNNGLVLSEAWTCNFKNIKTHYITGTALYVVGQVVNCNFIGCSFGTTGQGGYGVYIDGGTYNGVFQQPEGLTFIGGFIGEAQYGVRNQNGLAIKFSNIIIDLNTVNAVLGYNMDDVTYEQCWLYSSGSLVINIADNVPSNGQRIVFDKCNIVPTGTNNSILIGLNNSGVMIEGCQLVNHVTLASGSKVTLIHNTWNQADTTGSIIGTPLYAINNTFKNSGTAV